MSDYIPANDHESRGLEASIACTNLTLLPVGSTGEPIRAPEAHQFPVGTSFFEWKVTGESFMKRILVNGKIELLAKVPCKCSCGKRRNVTSAKLTGKYTKSCGHDSNLDLKAVRRVDWAEKVKKASKLPA